jgi:hypothetical protein
MQLYIYCYKLDDYDHIRVITPKRKTLKRETLERDFVMAAQSHVTSHKHPRHLGQSTAREREIE